MKLSNDITINLPVLLESRLLVQANAGGGKSWALRRLLEQTAPAVQQLVIDPEGEFATLRERFDYVIAAPHGADAVASPKTAALLARRLLEAGVSAILDICDLKAHERQSFVRRFLEALVAAPRAIWRPVMVVIDEAHIFAPQSGSAEALPAVIDVASRGRKRGQCLVLATQRLSKLHKDCAAEMLNKLVGRTGLDVDVKRAADELGMTPRDAMEALRNLAPGEFFAFGPALTTSVERVRIGPVETTHPKPGHRLMQAPPAASKRVLASLAKLSDLEREAAEEAKTVEDLHKLVADLRGKVTRAEKAAQQAGVPEAEVDRRVRAAVAEALKHSAPAREYSGNILSSESALRRIAAIVDNELKRIPGGSPAATDPRSPVPSRGAQVESRPRPVPVASGAVATGLTGPEQRILDAIAWLNAVGVDAPEQTAIAFMAGYTIGGGAYNNPRGSLRTKGLIESKGDTLVLTDTGHAAARAPESAGSQAELQQRVLDRLPGPERKLLTALIEAWPHELPNEELAARTGYTPGGGAFNNPRGRLRTLGLIEYRNGASRARDILFPGRSQS